LPAAPLSAPALEVIIVLAPFNEMKWTRSYCYRKWIRFIARLLYWFDAWYGGGRCPAPGKKCSTREQWMPQWEDKLWLADCFFSGFRVVFQYLFTLVHVGIPSYLSMLYIYIYIYIYSLNSIFWEKSEIRTGFCIKYCWIPSTSVEFRCLSLQF